MFVKNKGIARKAWNILRLVLLWARKGGLFKRSLVIILGRSSHGHDRLRCMEREFSFEKTPVVHVKMHRPHSMRFVIPRLPCINPHTDYDYDFDCDDCSNSYGDGNIGCYNAERISWVDNYGEEDPTPRMSEATEGIDSKAEEFIAKFYEQMKLQRQISNLEYYDTQNRSSS